MSCCCGCGCGCTCKGGCCRKPKPLRAIGVPEEAGCCQRFVQPPVISLCPPPFSGPKYPVEYKPPKTTRQPCILPCPYPYNRYPPCCQGRMCNPRTMLCSKCPNAYDFELERRNIPPVCVPCQFCPCTNPCCPPLPLLPVPAFNPCRQKGKKVQVCNC